jgi:hypothetical protein
MLTAPLPGAPPVKPVPDGADQLKVVPDGTTPFIPLTGVTEKPNVLHTAEVIAVMAGLGFTVTITVKFAPVQLPDIGVTV